MEQKEHDIQTARDAVGEKQEKRELKDHCEEFLFRRSWECG